MAFDPIVSSYSHHILIIFSSYSPISSHIIPYYPILSHILIIFSSYSPISSHIIPYYPILSHILIIFSSYSPISSHIIPYYPILSHIIPYSPTWFRTIPLYDHWMVVSEWLQPFFGASRPVAWDIWTPAMRRSREGKRNAAVSFTWWMRVLFCGNGWFYCWYNKIIMIILRYIYIYNSHWYDC